MRVWGIIESSSMLKLNDNINFSVSEFTTELTPEQNRADDVVCICAAVVTLSTNDWLFVLEGSFWKSMFI